MGLPKNNYTLMLNWLIVLSRPAHWLLNVTDVANVTACNRVKLHSLIEDHQLLVMTTSFTPVSSRLTWSECGGVWMMVGVVDADGGQTGHPEHVLPFITNVVGMRISLGHGRRSRGSSQSTTGQSCCSKGL